MTAKKTGASRYVRSVGSALFTFIALPICLLSGCKKEGQTTSATEIIIGEYGSMSGSEATFGQSTDKGIQLAFEQINSTGGVLGKKLKLIVEDDRGDQNEAITVVKKLINRDGVAAILGEVASSNSMAGGGQCENDGVPMISPSSTNPDVTKGKQYVFRVCFTDDFQGSVGAAFGVKKGWKKVAILTTAKNFLSSSRNPSPGQAPLWAKKLT
jgi:branched-chain amino acid transport system substrate-binding protein